MSTFKFITLYDLTFTFFILLTGVTVVASGAGLIFQAKLTGSTANWNVFIIVGSYVALAIVSVLIYLSRKTSIARRLKAIPKSYIAIKTGDVPTPVSNLIATEYNRACIISHVSQPDSGFQEGWGLPGTKFEGIRFRQAILNTLSQTDAEARRLLPTLPPIRPHLPPKQHLKPLADLIATLDPTCLDLYDYLIEKARYEDSEPTAVDYERCLLIVGRLREIFGFYLSQLRDGEHSWSTSPRTSLETGVTESII